MKTELSSVYDSGLEESIYRKWLESGAFTATVDERQNRYVVMMPLPNVTGALHMGHAMDNVMQDLLIRWHRMMGDNTLWMPGTDHAGIATQAVIEKQLMELEGKTRRDIGREALVARIWEWKDQYEKRIVEQLQRIGSSCDWSKMRFTLDDVCSAAVRETFFSMFKDRLIYRGNRLVNWDCQLQTAISDDEIYYETVQGAYYYLRYPVIDAKPGEPEYVVVATTRPETMLGDTAVACNPHPAEVLNGKIADLQKRLERISGKEKPVLEAELERLEKRKTTHLPLLETFVTMAAEGRRVMLPLQERPIPLILDEWAKPELGSGCVKITPSHDPNDYEVWQRHKEEIAIVNILAPEGILNENAGAYKGMGINEARQKVLADLKTRDLVEQIEEAEIEIGHSDRSKTPIEPYVSRQWFVRMGDVEGGIICGRGTAKEFHARGLAQAAMDAVDKEWHSPSGRQLTFHPDAERYGSTYSNWLAEKRDWCISRQLWWGHRIPIWSNVTDFPGAKKIIEALSDAGEDDIAILVTDSEGKEVDLHAVGIPSAAMEADKFEVQVCLRGADQDEKYLPLLNKLGLEQDPDVLDTWFSSALWPHSTLGWPDPGKAKVNEDQLPLGAGQGRADALSYYYPGSCLVTGRDIITLWVVRMVVTGLYNLGDLPFTDVFIHANILDGKGERMSKSKGNGIDPVDIIKRYGVDAMRYVLCDMQTGTQDIHLPVQAISPFTGEVVELAAAKHGRSLFTYICPKTKKEFDVLGTIPDLPAAEVISDRFDIGKSFCTKLWNASRLVLMNLEEQEFKPLAQDQLCSEDKWILSRLSRVIEEVTNRLKKYNPSAALNSARDFFWSEYCDWYLELVKPRLREESEAFATRQVLAAVLDRILRLFHPFTPYITETIWGHLRDYVPVRGIDRAFSCPELLITADWPQADIYQPDEQVEDTYDLMKEVIRSIRNLRSKYNIAPSKELQVHIKANTGALEKLESTRNHILYLCKLSRLEMAPDPERPKLSAVQVFGDLEIYVSGVLDPKKELERLQKQKEKIASAVEGIKKKLANENFVDKAPEKVVAAERERLETFTAELQSIEENIGQIK
jgi:valyl-tRNA synthetase